MKQADDYFDSTRAYTSFPMIKYDSYESITGQLIRH